MPFAGSYLTDTHQKFIKVGFAKRLRSGVASLSIMAVSFAPIVHRLLHILHVEVTSEKVG